MSILKPGLKIHSDILNKWSKGLGIAEGEYEVYQIHADYFTVIVKGWIPIPVSKHLFIEFYDNCMASKAKFMDKVVKQATSREYGIETVKMTSGREMPVPNYPKGGYVGMYFGYLDSHGDVILKGAFNKDTMYKTTVNFDPKELSKILKNSQRQVGNYADKLKPKQQNGKTINIPRKVATIKRGEGFTGCAIAGRARTVTITVGHLSDKA